MTDQPGFTQSQPETIQLFQRHRSERGQGSQVDWEPVGPGQRMVGDTWIGYHSLCKTEALKDTTRLEPMNRTKDMVYRSL